LRDETALGVPARTGLTQPGSLPAPIHVHLWRGRAAISHQLSAVSPRLASSPMAHGSSLPSPSVHPCPSVARENSHRPSIPSFPLRGSPWPSVFHSSLRLSVSVVRSSLCIISEARSVLRAQTSRRAQGWSELGKVKPPKRSVKQSYASLRLDKQSYASLTNRAVNLARTNPTARSLPRAPIEPTVTGGRQSPIALRSIFPKNARRAPR
jgi:hypothetical protein